MKCEKCGHTWTPRKEDAKTCPHCRKSRSGMPAIKVVNLKCSKCKHTWVSRIADPRLCPGCKTPYWRANERNKKGDIIRA